MSRGVTPAIFIAALAARTVGGKVVMSRLCWCIDPVHAQPDAAHPDRPVGVAVDDILGGQDDRGGAVALRGAVVEPEWIDHHRGGQRLLDGDLVTQLGFRVLQCVEVVLHRHHGHVFLGRRRLVQVPVDVQREIGRARPSPSG